MNPDNTNWLMRAWYRVFPRVPDFHSMVGEQADCLVQAFQALEDYIDDAQEARAKQLRDCVSDGHGLRQRNLDTLLRAYITPIDREDIHILIIRVDHVFDYVKTALREMETLGVSGDRWMRAMVDQLQEGSADLTRALDNFKRAPRLAAEPAEHVRHIERHVEKLYREALADMFGGEAYRQLVTKLDANSQKDSLDFIIDLMKRREVYRHLSNAADRLAHVGEQLHDMSVKYE